MSPKHTHTILSMMKDEGHSVLEWLAYHRLVGFDNVCVYTNDCSDGTDLMLKRLEEMGECRHFDNRLEPGEKPQPTALKKATLNAEVMDSAWILVIDADEFLTVKTGEGRVKDLVAALPGGTDGICITWRFFGSAGRRDYSTEPVLTRHQRCAPEDFRKGWGVKSMFRPYPGVRLGIHRPHMTDQKEDPARLKILLDQAWVNGSGEPIDDDFKLSGWRLNRKTYGYDLAEVNHYAVKSFEDYLLRRIRGNVNLKSNKYDDKYFALFDRNEERSAVTAAWAPAVAAKVAEWLKDPVLRRLQDKAHAYHRANIERLRANPDYAGWMAELEAAAEIPLDEVDEMLFTHVMPKDARQEVSAMKEDGKSEEEIAAAMTGVQTARAGSNRERMKAAMDAALAAGETPGGTLAEVGFQPGSAGTVEELTTPAGETEMPEKKRRGPDSATRPKVVVSTMKNEAPYLLEWIAHHLSVGFDHFVIFSNDCDDGTNLMLNRLEQLGIVSHFENPLSERRKDPQRSAYSRARKVDAVRQAEWVMILDADEFLNVRCGTGTVVDLIEACEGADAISVNWHLMGSSGETRYRDRPITERFTRGANLDDPENGLVWGFKTLFRLKAFDYFGVHRPRFFKERVIAKGYLKWVNGSGQDTGDAYFEKGWRSNGDRLGYDLAVVNHYAVKSREEFLLKRARGTANSKDKDRIDLDYWDKFNLGSWPGFPLRDTGMAAKLAELKADPVLGALHLATVENARRGIVLQQEDEVLRAFVEAGETAEAEAEAAAPEKKSA